MAPPLSDTNFVDEGSLIGIRQTEEDPKTWNSREQQNQYQDEDGSYLRTRSLSQLTGRSIMDEARV